MYLIDTNHLSRLLLDDATIRQHIADIGEENVAISVITQGEIFYMAYNSEQQEQNLRIAQRYLNALYVYRLNSQIAKLYGQLKAELIHYYGPKRRKTKIEDIGISDHDLWIACTAIHYELSIVSTDRDFLRIQAVMKFPLASWV
ncbi:type II toxin-antitoxin system VapC family toxin [Leptolyngbya sp. BC1307]|uniref:type II toxin-antitoxin system VapC family toxin n=1 Tax=Leptolyngbya sp. BC1307 TaxID=2029589 RepID=UPI000EFD9C8A|nr:type II toxin-antitoxin system VapC family toxin [Leptolyngbya sp. BC1307]